MALLQQPSLALKNTTLNALGSPLHFSTHLAWLQAWTSYFFLPWAHLWNLAREKGSPPASLFFKKIFNWRLITLQYCGGFCHTFTWISHGCTYMCSTSWPSLPPPSASHPSGSPQCTSPEHPASCIEPGLAIYFTYDNIHVSVLFSQIIPPSPSPTWAPTNKAVHYELCKYWVVCSGHLLICLQQPPQSLPSVLP